MEGSEETDPTAPGERDAIQRLSVLSCQIWSDSPHDTRSRWAIKYSTVHPHEDHNHLLVLYVWLDSV